MFFAILAAMPHKVSKRKAEFASRLQKHPIVLSAYVTNVDWLFDIKTNTDKVINMAKALPSFSDQIRRLIDDSEESRYRIAVECGIDHALMSRFMAGKVGLSMATLDTLAEHLGWRIVAHAKRTHEKK